MAKDVSFDIVSKLDLQEVDNAVRQAQKEIETRFDFKGSKSDIRLDNDSITLVSDDEYKLSQLLDVLHTKLVKRQVSLKTLKPGKIEPASAGTVRQVFALQQGISQENAKKITKLIKDTKLKIQVTIQSDQVRVSGKNKDELQAVIQILKEAALDVPIQFSNYR